MRMLLLCCVGFLYAGTALQGASGPAASIVGTWRYVDEVDTRLDGTPAPSSVLSASEGLLIYTSEGTMSVVIMPKERAWSVENASLPQLRETVENGTAYAGRYELDPEAGTVTHAVAVSHEPRFVGQRLVRQYELDGDRSSSREPSLRRAVHPFCHHLVADRAVRETLARGGPGRADPEPTLLDICRLCRRAELPAHFWEALSFGE